MKKEATIYDIAKALNLSASTVSRALKGNTLINIETRKKVLACAHELGYRSNAFASNLRTRRTNTIGVIVPRLDSNFMSACLAGMEEIASENGFNLIISQSHERVSNEEQNSTTMYNSRVDGLIVSLTIEESDLSYFKRFDEKKVPIVYFDRVPDECSHACVVIDNYHIAYAATQHLIDQGCKQLVHVTINSKSNVYAHRMRGFNDATANCPKCRGHILTTKALSIETGKELVGHILKMIPSADGIFVANDQAAIGLLIGLQEKGIKIPHQIAIIGFNNDPITTIVSPQLSTILYPGREAGRLAVKSLIESINQKNPVQAVPSYMLNSTLIIRGSSKRK